MFEFSESYFERYFELGNKIILIPNEIQPDYSFICFEKRWGFYTFRILIKWVGDIFECGRNEKSIRIKLGLIIT